MKNIKFFISGAAMILALVANSQIKAPQPSPTAEIEQIIGLTEVEVEYSRPGMKGRKIFGDLEKFGAMWRTGANKATKVSFGDDVTVGGQTVPAGDYSLFTIPGETEWTIVLNKNLELWGTGGYDKAMDQCRFMVIPTKLNDAVETFTIDFSHFTTSSANMNLAWENTKVSFPIVTPANEMVDKQIKEQLMSPPSAGTYFAAANFYLDQEKDLKQALEWINKAVDARPEAFWYGHAQAKILHANGMKTEAIAAAEKSMTMAKANKDGDYGYVKNNEDLIKKIKATK
jgi:hypothetical protein